MAEGRHSVAVLGAGHGGMALAGYLSLRGNDVVLWNRSPEPVEEVAVRGGVELSMGNAGPRYAPLAGATTDIGAAIESARLVVVALPALAHADVARACAPHLRSDHCVLLVPGRTGGSLEFRRVLRRARAASGVLVGEANTFPFASRRTGPGEARIFGTKREILAAALPAFHTAELIDRWSSLLPMIAPASSVLETGFDNLGAILHPVIALHNADRIVAGESFDFYTDGVTEAVADALAEADAERCQAAAAYGVPALTLAEWIEAAYGHSAPDLRGTVGGNPAYRGIKAPGTLVHRYLLEDVPTGLVPLIGLAEAAGVAVPALRRLADAAREALGGMRWTCAPRTPEALGLAGMTPAQVRAEIEGGAWFHPAWKRDVVSPELMGSASA